MIYVARKTFVHHGKRYVPGDQVEDFPHGWPRPESSLHTGLIVAQSAKPAPKRAPRKTS